MNREKIVSLLIAALLAACAFLYVRLNHYQERVELLEGKCTSLEETLKSVEASVEITQKSMAEWAGSIHELTKDTSRKKSAVRAAAENIPWASCPVPADIVRLLK